MDPFAVLNADTDRHAFRVESEWLSGHVLSWSTDQIVDALRALDEKPEARQPLRHVVAALLGGPSVTIRDGRVERES